MGDWSSETARPEFDKRSFAARMREQKKLEAEETSSTTTKAKASTRKPKNDRGKGSSKNESSHPVDSEGSKEEEDQTVEHHITVFLPINGAVWEIDSMMSEPRRIGLIGEGDWSLEVRRYLASMSDTIGRVSKAPQLTYAAAIYHKQAVDKGDGHSA